MCYNCTFPLLHLLQHTVDVMFFYMNMKHEMSIQKHFFVKVTVITKVTVLLHLLLL